MNEKGSKLKFEMSKDSLQDFESDISEDSQKRTEKESSVKK